MRINFILLCASLVVADNFELKYLPLMGKLDDKRSVLLSNSRIIASLRRHDVHICSAALLSNQHALTTAICLKGLLNETGIPRFDQFTLVAGRYDIDNGTTVFKIGQVQVHKRFMFSAPNALHNVGLITMRENDVEESEYVGWGIRQEKRPICGETADLLAWENVDGSHRVKKITVQLVKVTFCNFHHHSAIICVIFVDDNKTLSEDDLGAPLLQNNVIIGILSSMPNEVRQSVFFIDLFKSRGAISKLIEDCVTIYKDTLPRKKARYDYIAFSSNKKVRQFHFDEINHKETNHEEAKHEKNNHKETNH